MESNKPRILDIGLIADARGNLSVLQHPGVLPFDPVRTYWLTDVPSGAMRDGHAYYTTSELIIALSGCVNIIVEDADGRRSSHSLARPDQALYIPPMTWRELSSFATNSVVMIVANTIFDEADYIRTISTFRELSSTDTRS